MKVVISIFILFLLNSAFAQSWNLDKCLKEALENSYDIKSQNINSSIATENLKTAKFNFLPTLNGGATHGYNWGQTIDPFTNQFATNQVQTNSFYLASSLVLFNGLQNRYNLKIKQFDLETEQLTSAIKIRTIKINTATAYFQVLLNNEILEIAKQQLQLTHQEKINVEALIEQGNEVEWKLDEIKTQIMSDEFLMLQAQNDLNYSLLMLQHSMAKTYDSSFNVLKVDSSITETNNGLTEINRLPEIELLQIKLDKKEIELKASKSKVLPSLQINGSMGTGYSGNNKEFDTNGALTVKPFRNQTTENFYQSVSLNLSIPIFNKLSTNQEVKLQELNLAQQKLDQNQEKMQLFQKIEKLQLDISAGKSQIKLQKSLLNLTEKKTSNYALQYKLGVITRNEVQIQKNELFEMQSKLIQAKYKLYLNQFVLSLY